MVRPWYRAGCTQGVYRVVYTRVCRVGVHRVVYTRVYASLGIYASLPPWVRGLPASLVRGLCADGEKEASAQTVRKRPLRREVFLEKHLLPGRVQEERFLEKPLFLAGCEKRRFLEKPPHPYSLRLRRPVGYPIFHPFF